MTNLPPEYNCWNGILGCLWVGFVGIADLCHHRQISSDKEEAYWDLFWNAE